MDDNDKLISEIPAAPADDDQQLSSKYIEILDQLFWDALRVSPFGTVCSVLRVGGMADAQWDPFEEARDAFTDYNWILERVQKERGTRAARRVGLLMYCQAVEMSAPHEVLANLLRSISGEHYVINPFSDLGRRSKKNLFSYVPPSAKAKMARLRAMAESVSRADLVTAFDTVFNDAIRNAFSHSDYVLTDTHFRYSDGGLAQQMDNDHMDEIILECFDFYSSFLGLQNRWLRRFGAMPRYHKWPQYEVLELLTDSDKMLTGFSVHFSNGSKAKYTRSPTGTTAMNLFFDRDGGVGFQMGSLDDLRPEWRIDGKTITDWSEFPREEVPRE